jgi:hypothetical protein
MITLCSIYVFAAEPMPTGTPGEKAIRRNAQVGGPVEA